MNIERAVDGTVVGQTEGDKAKKTNDHSNFTARIVSLSSVSMQICFDSIASFSGGGSEAERKILLERAENRSAGKNRNVTMSGDGSEELARRKC